MAEIIHQHNGTMDKHIGIGISTGKVFSGILGSIRKREFTSIGMAVNMATRLQRLAGVGEAEYMNS